MNDGHKAIQRRRGAPPAGQRLTREAVLTRAEHLIDRDGWTAFSLRSLARELDVRPAALYNHVADREDLLQAVTSRFVADFTLAEAGDRAWPDWVRSVAVDLHRRMVDHPRRAELLLASGPGRPAGIGFLRRFLDDLGSAGVDRATAHLIWHVLMTVVLGTVQMEKARGEDPAGSFDAVLDVALDGITALAARLPGDRLIALLHAHRAAEDPDSPT